MFDWLFGPKDAEQYLQDSASLESPAQEENINSSNHHDNQGSVRHNIKFSDNLDQACNQLEEIVYQKGSLLSVEASLLSLRAIDLVREIIILKPQLHATTEHNLKQTIRDYLPSLIFSYEKASIGGNTNEKDLEEKITVMVTTLQDILTVTYDDNDRDLESQGIFLENKFGGYDLG